MGEKRKKKEEAENDEKKTKKKRRRDVDEEEEEEQVQSEVVESKKEKKHKKKSRTSVGEEETEAVPNTHSNEVEESKKEKKRKRKSRTSVGEEETAAVPNGHSNGKGDIIDVVAGSSSVLSFDVVESLARFLADNVDDDGCVSSIRRRLSVSLIGSLLSSYNATRSMLDLKIFDVLVTIERRFRVNISSLGPLVFGAQARDNYEKLAKLGKFLHVKLTPNEVVKDYIDGSTLWSTVIHCDRQTVHDTFYDIRFVLRLASSLVYPGSELNCRLFVERNLLALAFVSQSTPDADTRRVGAFLLQRFLNLLMELKSEDFPEKSLFVYLIRLYKNSVTEEAQKISHMVSHFFARVTKLTLNPGHELYAPVWAFLTLRAYIESDELPMFFRLLTSSSTEHHEVEQVWAIDLILDALIDQHDYAVMQKKSALSLIGSLFASPLSRQNVRKSTLALLKRVARMPGVAHDATAKYNMTGWIAAAIQRPSLSRWETIYLGEVFSLLAETLRESANSGKNGQPSLRTYIALTSRPVLKALDGVEQASKKLITDIEECLAGNWTPTNPSCPLVDD